MSPYLTWMWTLAPFSTGADSVPVAVMVRFLPLPGGAARQPGILCGRGGEGEGELTLRGGWARHRRS